MNAQGSAPVYLKIRINNKNYERSTGIWCKPEHWNGLYKRVEGHPQLNATLLDIEAKLLLAPKGPVNIGTIDNLLNSKQTAQTNFTLIEAIHNYINCQQRIVSLPDGVTLSTFKTYLYRQKNLVAFLVNTGRQNMYPDGFKASVGLELKEYLYKQLNFSTGHVNKHLKLIKTVLKWAHYEYGTPLTNFMAMKIKTDHTPDIVYLGLDEVQKIEQHTFASTLLQKAADLFLMQCYTGMSYCDVININIDMVKIGNNGKTYLVYRRGKTKVKGIVPLSTDAISLMNKYNYTVPKLCNQLYNRLLKEVAQVCEIDKKITSHTGRKTFATLQLNNGYTAEAVTRMLAKTNVRETTKVYADIIL